MNYNEQQLQTRRWAAAKEKAPSRALAAGEHAAAGLPVLAAAAHACGDRTELLTRAMPDAGAACDGDTGDTT